MRASRGMGDIKPSKMPGKKIIQRTDSPQDVEVYAKGGRIGGNVTVSKAGTPSAVVRKLLAKPGSLKASDLFAKGGAAQQAATAISMKENGKQPKKMASGGLYENIHKKQARIAAGSGERMRKVGSKGAPTKADFIKSAKTAKKK
jgi:hypothetical protein